MEERQTVQAHIEEHAPPPKRSSAMLVFWIALIMVAGFASVGYYVDSRLASLEEKILLQSSTITAQAESTIDAIQSARKDILGNRAEAAKFSQTFSSTIDDMSGLLSNAVNAFSKQTQLLTEAVEQKEKNQTEFLQTTLERLEKETITRTGGIQTAIAHLAEDVASTKEAALGAQSLADSANGGLERLNTQITQLGQDFSSGYTSLTELSQQMNATVGEQFQTQIQIMAGKMDELRAESDNNLKEVQTHLTAIASEIETESQTLNQLSESVCSGLTESRKTGSELRDQLQSLADNTELAFAAATEDRDMIRADVTEMDFALEGRTDDLSIKLAASQECETQTARETGSKLDVIAQAVVQAQTSITESGAETVAAFESFSKNAATQIQQLNGELASLSQQVNTVGETMLERLEGSLGNEKRFPAETAATIDDLKQLTEQMVSLHGQVLESVASTRAKAAAWIDDAQSLEAREAFDEALESLTHSIESALDRVDSIKTEVSKFAAHYSQSAGITEADSPPAESSDPIGMTTLQPEEDNSD